MADELLVERLDSSVAFKFVWHKAVKVLYWGLGASDFFHVEGFEDLVNVS